MLDKNQRLRNLRQARIEISQQIEQWMQEQGICLNEFSKVSSWPVLYLRAITENRASPNIGELNYLASIFDCKLKIEFVK